MEYKSVSSSYKETRVKTASQGQLIIMLYDEVSRQLGIAIELLESDKGEKKDPGKIEQISKAVMKAEEIITELMVSLDFDQGGDIAKNLFSLYSWFNKELLEANIAKDANRIKTVRSMMSTLRDSWSDIAGKHSEPAKQESIGLNIAG